MSERDGGGTIAILGAGGIMGSAVAATARLRGYSLRLYNRTPRRLEGVAGPSDVVSSTPADAARSANAVLSFVTDDEASERVWFGPDGAAGVIGRDVSAIECSTLSPGHVASWARRLDDVGADPVAAPVTGSREGAATGRLVVFAGGRPESIDRAAPLLESLSCAIYRFPTPADAARVKLINNLLGCTILVALAEALALADGAGLDPGELVEIFAQHGWGSPVARGRGMAMCSGDDDDPACTVETIAKDYRYALAEAASMGLELRAARSAAEAFESTSAAGFGARDMAAVRRIYREAR